MPEEPSNAAEFTFNRSKLSPLPAILLLVLFTMFSRCPSSQAKTKSTTVPKNAVSLVSNLTKYLKTDGCDSFNQNQLPLRQKSELVDTLRSQLGIYLKKPAVNSTSQKEETTIVEFLHRATFCFFKQTRFVPTNQRLSWNQLSDQLQEIQSPNDFLLDLSLIWIEYLRDHNQRLAILFQTPFLPSSFTKDQLHPYIRYQDALLTDGQASMWRHCQKRFNNLDIHWRVKLISGFISEAFQLYVFQRSNISLSFAMHHYPPPGYGNFQKTIPNMRFSLISEAVLDEAPPWNKFYDTCSPYGIEPAYPEIKGLEPEASFKGMDVLYQDIFTNPLIPKYIVRDLPDAMRASEFYPSPQGLKVILALSAQESTIQWNPKLNEQKKSLLRRRFDNVLSKIHQSIPDTVSNFFLSEEHKKKLKSLIEELHHLTDTEQAQTREYDFYLWSRKTYNFIIELTNEYKQMAKLGQWFFDLQSLQTRLEKEPQTFGLWQINVNHLQEKIRTFKQLRRAFPEIYQKTNGRWIVNRSWLIDALSGRPNSRLSRKRTLELIIHTHLKPHYENHLLGDKNDLMYFIAENMSGEMSTFRAAIQKELNKKMRSSLKTDGDLNYYLPYSTDIDWEKESNTYLKLKEFVTAHQYYFNKPVHIERLIRELCEAKSWRALNSLELYRKLIDKDAEVRIFPDIRSNLYNQTPLAYAKLVTRKSLLF